MKYIKRRLLLKDSGDFLELILRRKELMLSPVTQRLVFQRSVIPWSRDRKRLVSC